MDATDPIEDSELEGLFSILRGRDIVLAVSGGADSTALMVLVARWLAAKKGIGLPRRVSVLTVDHGLRQEARAEALAVATAAAGLGFDHKILSWQGAKPRTGLQEAARLARYRLIGQELESSAGDAEARTLVLAHTLDDQAETFMMRLARGSGIEGLAAMRRLDTLEVDGRRLTLCRPLLRVPKARLVATLKNRGIAWSEDPSNAVELFERVRVRRALAELKSLGVDARAIARSAARLGRADRSLAAFVERVASQVIDWHDGAYAAIDLGKIGATGAASAEVLVRVLSQAIAVMGGESLPPQLAQIERLADQLDQASTRRKAFKTSLGGCLIEAKAGTLEVCREPGRRGLPVLRLEPGATCHWDRRFAVSADRRLGGPIVIEALGTQRWAKLKAAHPGLKKLVLPARAAATLPAYTLDGFVHIGPVALRGVSVALLSQVTSPFVSIAFDAAAWKWQDTHT